MNGSTTPRLHAGRRDDASPPTRPAAGLAERIAACAAVGLAPFALHHVARGEATTAGAYAGIVLGLAGLAVHARRGGDARIVAWIAAALATAGCMLLVALEGAAGSRWAYAAIAANALLLRPREAAVVSAALVGAVGLADAHAAMSERVGFVVSASLVAVAMHAFAQRLHRQEAERDAHALRDPLTGAGNLRAFESELRLAAEAARRERRPCGVAVLDVDHLGRLIERHGAATGAQVLVDFANVVGQATRRTDRLFRIDDETFVMLLPGADTAVLGPMLDSLRLRIGDVLRVDGEVVSVSIGAAALRVDGDDADAWMARAQAALEHARRAGRNRVEVSDCTVTADGAPIRAG